MSTPSDGTKQNHENKVAIQIQHPQQDNGSQGAEVVTAEMDEEQTSSSPQDQTEGKSNKSDTTNFTDYQRVWILICLDRARTVLGMDSQSKITTKLHRYTCELLHVDRERSLIYRKPTIKSLKTIWQTFIEHKQISRKRKGGPKPKKCREEVENLLRQNMSFRQIVKKLKPDISISTTTVGRIAESMKKEQNKRQKALQKEKKQAQNSILSNQEPEIAYSDNLM